MHHKADGEVAIAVLSLTVLPLGVGPKKKA